ncbi:MULTISPECIES: amidinotransferase [unclassified Serratia (in: enterobacteria)]|uniref:amidinotransferase n=1 Tax=unclassified Serratia (in: enterobacteria) TaxID=2647522 RepID=UPI00307659C1
MTIDVSNKNTIGAFTEWDPLEEVLLGDPLGAMKPGEMTVFESVIPQKYSHVLEQIFPDGVNCYPADLIECARKEVTELKAVLESEGVRVQVAEPIDFSKSIKTPHWDVPNQFCSSNPRDSLLLVGDMIIEAPMADRSRYFETFAYRKVLKDLNRRGARWISAPKPILSEKSFVSELNRDSEGQPTEWLTTEEEILFDAADFMKFGKDILVSRSHVTNDAGIDWVRKILGKEFTLHVIETTNPYAMHLDDTIMPLGKGRLLYSPDYFDPSALPDIFKTWEIFEAPPVIYSPTNRLGKLSGWLNINMLSLDEERIIVERKQEHTIAFLKKLGMKPILCDFENYFPFVGSFHCASLDIKRRGQLRNCF